nr:hypothetical protein [Gammaproteobacteria bacterium]
MCPHCETTIGRCYRTQVDTPLRELDEPSH